MSKHVIQEWFEDYRNKVVYDRAIPSVMDGFKSIHRKIYYTALNNIPSKGINTAAFSGYVKSYSNYHHGDMSIDATINTLTMDHKNLVPMFNGEGNFGTKLVPDAASARYTEVKLNSNFTKYMIFNEILNYTKQDDNEIHEPDFYLFSIPMVLVNGIYGIAVGLSTEILAYSIIDIKENILNVLNKKPLKKMVPVISKFKGKIVWENDKWTQYGCFEIVNSTTIKITELPSNQTQEKYITYLQKLKDSKFIYSYSNGSVDDYEFIINLPRSYTKEATDEKIYKDFKLISTLSENINVLNKEKNEVLHFNSPEELINYYVSEMLIYFQKYIDYKIKYNTDLINKLQNKIKFIEYISKINLKEFTIKQIRENIIKEGIILPEFISEFMEMSINHFTVDYIKKYEEEIKELEKILKKYLNISIKNLYIEVLNN